MIEKKQQFLKLVNEHTGILQKVSRLYMQSQADREDLVQEIMFQLWRSFDRFKGESKFSTWMYRVAINTALTFSKNYKKHLNYTQYTTPPDIANIGEVKQKDVELDVFYKATESLNPVEKALIFYFLEGFSYKEIGRQLGISEVNARVKFSRIKEKLQKIIKSHGYEF